MIDLYKHCHVMNCLEPRADEFTLCSTHKKLWINVFNAFYDHDIPVNMNTFCLAFRNEMLTMPHLYPAKPTAEQVYEWLRSNE